MNYSALGQHLIYTGRRTATGVTVTKLPHNSTLSVAQSRAIKDCAETFDYGNRSDATHQLAIALLCDFLDDARMAREYHEVVVEQQLADLSADEMWRITGEDLEDAIRNGRTEETDAGPEVPSHKQSEGIS